MKKINLMGISTTALLFSMSAFAASSPATATSTASKNDISPSVSEKIRMSYFGQFIGPSVGSPSRYGTNDLSPRDADTITLYNSIGLGYQVDKTIKVGASPRFEYRPAGTGTAFGPSQAGQDLRILDPRIFFEKGSLISTAEFNLKVQVNSELPASKESRANDLIAAPALSFSGDYKVRNTHLSLGFAAFYRAYFYGQPGALKGRQMRAYFAPNATYKLSKTVALTLNYEMDNRKLRTSNSLTDWKAEATDLQAGVAWDLSQKFSINPYLQIYPGGKISLDTTAFGMYLSGSVL